MRDRANEPACPMNELNVNEGHYDGRYEVHAQHRGLTIREHFAGLAMQGILAGTAGLETREKVIACAVQCADMLIAAIAKPAGGGA